MQCFYTGHEGTVDKIIKQGGITMIHPSYKELIEVINAGNNADETPLVTSRYSVVLATSKRARQIIAGDEPRIDDDLEKPLSTAVKELYTGKIHIIKDDAQADMDEESLETKATTDITRSIYIGEPKQKPEQSDED